MEPASEGDDLQSRVLQNTLSEVALRDEQAAECCVVCLEAISEPCEARPCGHRNFDYLCLANWLYEGDKTPRCPLCKADVVRVLHGKPIGSLATSFDKAKTAKRPENTPPGPLGVLHASYPRHLGFASEVQEWAWRPNVRHRPSRQYEPSRPVLLSIPTQREAIYRNNRYSKHVGSNRLSRYRELTPQLFCADSELVSRAKMFIRRELKVFTFLHTDSHQDSMSRHRVPGLRINNAEFLLEYIVAILKSVDIMGSGGQAANMLSDFLGAENSRLFLHELRAWLRSPYTKLEDWDRAVQYDDGPAPTYRESKRGSASRRDPREISPEVSPEPETRQTKNRDRYVSERYRERYRRKGDFYRPSNRNNAEGSGSRGHPARYEPYSNGRTESRP